jgi:hypothetical protein
MKLHRLLAAAACLACAASPVAGQSDSVAFAPIIACMRAHPEYASAPVVVYGYAHVDPTQEQAGAVRVAAENLLQPVADAMARLLGGKPGVLPVSDSTIPWYASRADVSVEATRDGRVTSHTDSSRTPTTTERYIEQAIDSAVAHESGPLVVTPDGVPPPERAHFHIFTSHAATGIAGFTLPMRYEGAAVPLFATRFPMSSQVDGPLDAIKPQFPEDVNGPRLEVTVIEQFAVDTNGRAVPSTFHEVWPGGVPGLTGDQTDHWDEFVRSVHNWLEAAHFKPATIASCPVRQLAQEPFEFNLGR